MMGTAPPRPTPVQPLPSASPPPSPPLTSPPRPPAAPWRETVTPPRGPAAPPSASQTKPPLPSPAIPPIQPVGLVHGVSADASDDEADADQVEFLPALDVAQLEGESDGAVHDHRPPLEGRSRKAVIALSLGAISVPLAFLALVPSAWTKAPATLAGFASLLYALLAINEIKQSRGRQTGLSWAAAGMVAGLVGMFLAPTLIARMGKRWHRESTRQFTESHLLRMGEGLNRYHDEHGAFPPGGVFRKRLGKGDLRLHGWMTALLPYLGEDALYQQIDQELPFDDPANFPALSVDLPLFFAAGSDRSKIGGLGASHFAGVGGEVVDDAGGYAQAGIFGINSHVTRDAVVDGLSQTLAAGQLGGNFPAWGEPENWRVIGRGINRDVEGFGNALNTGASFLMADGSVRFFSNKVDTQILVRLSTRNGGDKTEQDASPPPMPGQMPADGEGTDSPPGAK